MKQGKYESTGAHSQARRRRRRRTERMSVALLLAVVLLVGGVIGGTVAWLTAESQEVTNVFTTSDIDVELTETKEDFKMIPGWTIEKDPVVTVKGGSEDCWLFIKVEESGGNVKVKEMVDGTEKEVTKSFDDFIDYTIDPNNWEQLKDDSGNNVDGVYYCYAKDITADRSIKVLGYTDGSGNFVSQQVKVLDTVTKEMMNAIKTGANGNQPTLSFTAYATQYWQNNTTAFEPYAAWQQTPGYATN